MEIVIQPTYVDDDEYTISGTFEVSGEALLPLVGCVTRGCQHNYKPSNLSSDGVTVQDHPTSQGLHAEAQGAGGSVQWRMWTSNISSWVGPDGFGGTLTHVPSGMSYPSTVAK